MMNVIAMSAHPDDMEFEAGGTLAKWAKQGHSIYHIILTTDEKNIHRKEEAKNAAKCLGIKDVIFLDNKDTELKCSGALISELDEYVDKFEADVFVSHHPFDSHQDHKAAADLMFSVVRKGLVTNVLSGSPLPYRPNIFAFRPQYFVDITDTIDQKVEAIKSHQSQYSRYGSEKLINRIRSMASYYGWAMGYEYAECFEVIRMGDLVGRE